MPYVLQDFWLAVLFLSNIYTVLTALHPAYLATDLSNITKAIVVSISLIETNVSVDSV